MILKSRQETMSEHGYASACGRIEAALDRLLDKQLSDPDNMRLAKLLRKQRERLFTFLYVKAVQPTNNQAEREIRPAVIIRTFGQWLQSRQTRCTHPFCGHQRSANLSKARP